MEKAIANKMRDLNFLQTLQDSRAKAPKANRRSKLTAKLALAGGTCLLLP